MNFQLIYTVHHGSYVDFRHLQATRTGGVGAVRSYSSLGRTVRTSRTLRAIRLELPTEVMVVDAIHTSSTLPNWPIQLSRPPGEYVAGPNARDVASNRGMMDVKLNYGGGCVKRQG